MSVLIEVKNLRKKFDFVQAVDDISLTVNQGEILGFLGPNGSGKTTTMRMITGYLTPDAGEISICGTDVINSPQVAKQYIGYLPEGASTYADMKVSAYLEFISTIRLLSKKEAHDAISYIAERTGISDVMSQSIGTLSKGYKRRVGLAQAILCNQEVLILDEPTDGLDPNQKHEIYKLILEISKSKAIIISTHILEEVEALCTRAIIIAKGKIVADNSVNHFIGEGKNFNKIFRNLTQEVVSDKKEPTKSAPIIEKTSQENFTTIKNTITIFKREFLSYFTTPLAYVIIAVFIALSNSLTFFLGGFFINNEANLDTFFQFHPWLFLFFIPAIAMRLWAEERNNGSIEILLTLPISTFSIVLGKFIAAWCVVGLCLLLTTSMWLSVNYLGNPDNTTIALGYIGSFVVAGAYLSISTCISALSKNQIIAFVLSALICFIFTANGLAFVQDFFNAWAPSFVILTINNLSFLEHFRSFVNGVIDMRDIVFFASTIMFFIFINNILVENVKEK